MRTQKGDIWRDPAKYVMEAGSGVFDREGVICSVRCTKRAVVCSGVMGR